ncbi:hypothetical protein EMIT079MI2_210059 [Bacillus sp. IT-79MI2]
MTLPMNLLFWGTLSVLNGIHPFLIFLVYKKNVSADNRLLYSLVF